MSREPSRERPILFSAPMVRAILAGTKTQTRRLVKPQPTAMQQGWMWVCKKLLAGYCHTDADAMVRLMLPHCPYGEPGDRLWVRETWSPDPPIDSSWASTEWNGCGRRIDGVPERFQHPRFCNYSADWLHGPIVWRPSIHMPRWASRITLEVTGVRVERLQDISEADAMAEGAPWGACGSPQEGSRKAGFAKLWDSINGPNSWDANPWVWAINFKRLA